MSIAEIILYDGSQEKPFEIREGEPLFIGRAGGCDICLPSPAVSRRHAVFMNRGGKCGLKDLDSSNGTYVNGKRIAKPVRLRYGDVIQIASFSLVFAMPKGEGRLDPDKTVILPFPQAIAASEAVPEAKHLADDHDVAAPSALAEEKNADVSGAADDESSMHIPPLESPARAGASTEIRPVEDVLSAELASPDPKAEQAARASVRVMPKPPSVPPTIAKPAPDEIGDGDDDASFMVEAGAESGAEGIDPGLALSAAAAEAGLVGEFAPEPDAVPEEEPGGGREAPLPGVLVQDVIGFPPPREPDPDAIPLDDGFRQAVETRLFLYSFLSDLATERKELLEGANAVPDAVKSELQRQEREAANLPDADKAEDMIKKRLAKRDDLKAKIREAKELGIPLPPRPSRLMRSAEDIAINQWTIISQSSREALPAAFECGYRIAGREPIAAALSRAGIDARRLLGGAAYALALETLLEETLYNRAFFRAKLANFAASAAKRNQKGLLGFLNRSAQDDGETAAAAEGESYGEIEETERQLAQRLGWLKQEAALIEAMLVKEFWDVYPRVALAFLPDHRNMPHEVRAFLRYGVIGFQPWWLRDEVRRHIMNDCATNVRHEFEVSRNITNVAYADEYLAAVMEKRCTPALDENLEINEKNSPDWKADKALRRLIGARGQITLYGELVDSLGARIDKLGTQVAEMDGKIGDLLPGSKDFKKVKSNLMQQRQGHRVEIGKLTKLRDKIRDESIAELEESIAETGERFTSGELPAQEADFLIRRECGAIRRIGRLLSNLKERFLPLAMREKFALDTDAVNDRDSILAEFADIERRDPAVFLETIHASRKRAKRVDIRVSPVVVLVPAAGVLAFSWNPRQKPESGRLAIPTFFIRQRLRQRQLTYLLSDFRWDTAKAAAGMDVMNSDTIVAAFMGVRWDWRKRSREAREKGLVLTDQNDRTNWRRVYEAYMETAFDAGKKLYNRNYDFYERVIAKYFDLPEGLEPLRK